MHCVPLEAVLDSLCDMTLLSALSMHYGRCDLIDHWTQGEFHHDLVFETEPGSLSPARFLVVSTNCNGGVKEILALAERPDRWALWHWRCPDNPSFHGELAEIVDRVQHVHYFDPCEVLKPNARSELRPEARLRQRGGGWVPVDTHEELEPIQSPVAKISA